METTMVEKQEITITKYMYIRYTLLFLFPHLITSLIESVVLPRCL